jgi:hypothetical protein
MRGAWLRGWRGGWMVGCFIFDVGALVVSPWALAPAIKHKFPIFLMFPPLLVSRSAHVTRPQLLTSFPETPFFCGQILAVLLGWMDEGGLREGLL